MTKIFGHRGASKECPENTMISFQRAYEIGVHGIETDVQLSKDGIPVIIHDESVNRTTNGKGYIKNLTINEIKALDAGSWFSNVFRNETIPTLEELLHWIYTKPLLLNIELKNNRFAYEGLEKKVYDLVCAYGMKERTIISSFNHYSLVRMREIDDMIDIAPLYSSGIYEPWHYAKSLGARSVHPKFRSLPPYILEGFHFNQINVRPYTVNNKKWLMYFLDWKVDAIITDKPDLALSLLNGFIPPPKSFLHMVYNKLTGK
ncbi:glycerophosphodiester phosphodiesterase [Fictibacillus sp. Mic-4]|uniref:glycerophosphodiester phosphodiesterase n=1 Tax=Fictibacillus TaxID=1329200 RepID=UPI000405988A|nr:glycerophosphodiester phosphodiesterase [Fictibacillus gelatini]